MEEVRGWCVSLLLWSDPGTKHELGFFLHSLVKITSLAYEVFSLLGDLCELLEVSDELFPQFLFSLIATLISLREAISKVDLFLLSLFKDGEVVPHEV